MDPDSIESQILALLKKHKVILAVAESSTGGLITKRLTDPEGASAAVLGGVVAYDNLAKETVLRVPRQTMVDHGAVSEEAAKAMAQGASDCFQWPHRRMGPFWDHRWLALAETGITGPGGGSGAKPVGTVCLALTNTEGDVARTHHFDPNQDREQLRRGFAYAALKLLKDCLEGKTRLEYDPETYPDGPPDEDF